MGLQSFCCLFFNAIERISKKSYQPSLEDISKASVPSQSDQGLLIPRKSAGRRYQYRIVDTVGSNAGGCQWVYTSDTVSLVVHIADIATYDVTHSNDKSANELKQNVTLFQKVCSSRWLAETPVLVLLGNVEELMEKLPHSPIQGHFAAFMGQPGNVAHAKAFFRDLYLQADRKYKMRVWIDFLDKGVTAAIGKTAMGIIDRILTEESLLSYGLR
ncbi:MAG: hypothetical protein Q9207_002190 [Kuettlingeria erythrocarpa]